MRRIFVSYRREGTAGEAGRIVDRLRDRFGEDRVFLDTAAMQGGDRWRERIDEALTSCDVLIAVIGDTWLTVTDSSGRRRLDLPDDVLVYEICSALKRRIRLIPVLVQHAEPLGATAVPEALRGLCDYQVRRVRAESFDSDMTSLLHDIAGKWVLPSRRNLILAAALAALVIVPVAVYVLKPAPPVVRTVADLRLRVKLNPAIDSTLLAPDRMLLFPRLPDELSKSLLDNPHVSIPGQPEFSGRVIMPGTNESYEAELTRQPQTSNLAAGSASAPPPTMHLCFTAVKGARASQALVRMVCEEGGQCTTASDDLGLVRAAPCRVSESRNAWRRWPFVAVAQAAPDAERDGWVVPALDTLHRLHKNPNAPAFSEVSLQSAPQPPLVRARRASYQLRVNGRSVWVDGLPPNASAVPFNAETGLRLQFGLENLDFSGALAGKEKVEVTLRFLDDRSVQVAEWMLPLDFVALRTQDEPQPVGDRALGASWSARYFPSPGDRYQIFLLSSRSATEAESAKQRFDERKYPLRQGDAALSLVAVIRPPLPPRNDNFGVVVGIRQRTGQIRFSFDEPTSTALCRELTRLPGIRPDVFRREIEAQQNSVRCAALGRS